MQGQLWVLTCRERNDGLYTPMAYLLFKVFEECLLALGTSLLLSSAVFFLVGLHGNWLLFWGTFWLTTCTGIGDCWINHTLVTILAGLQACCESLRSALWCCSKYELSWLLHNLVEARFNLFRYLLLGDKLKP